MTVSNRVEKSAGRNTQVLSNIILKPDISRITNRFRFADKGVLPLSRARELLELALEAAAPKALYQTAGITGKDDHGLEIEGVRFSHPLLRFNLDKASLIFPYCASAGERLEAVDRTGGAEEKHCLNIIKQLILDETVKALRTYLTRQFHLPYIWSLAAGEMEAWPLSGLKELFDLLGDAPESIGVKLQPDFSLRPAYSQAGFFYFAETEFEGCQVCAKEPCMMRRAQYNADLAAQKGLKIRKVCGRDTA